MIAQDIWYDAPELRHLVNLGSGANPDKQKPVRNKDLTVDPDYSGWGPSVATVNYIGLIPYIIKSIKEIESEMPYVKSKVSNVDVVNTEDFYGLIVSSNSELSLSNKSFDNKCYGIIESKYEDTIDNEILVNTSKDGKIWIINQHNLEAGDYITTSEINGFGMKQTDDILHNYTVAKVLQDCDFNPKMEKVKRVSKELVKTNYYIRKEYSDVPKTEAKNYISKNNIVEIVELYYKKINNSDDENDISMNTNDQDPVIPEQYSEYEFDDLEDSIKVKYEKAFRKVNKTVDTFEFKSPVPGCEIEEREELVDKLDSNGQVIWEDTEETVPEYKIKYIDMSGNETHESNAAFKSALINCKMVL